MAGMKCFWGAVLLAFAGLAFGQTDTNTAGASGQLVIRGTHITRLTLQRTGDNHTEAFTEPNDVLSLPVGTYRIAQIILQNSFAYTPQGPSRLDNIYLLWHVVLWAFGETLFPSSSAHQVEWLILSLCIATTVMWLLANTGASQTGATLLSDTGLTQLFGISLMGGAILGIILYIINLPFLLLGALSPFYRKRFQTYMDLKPDVQIQVSQAE